MLPSKLTTFARIISGSTWLDRQSCQWVDFMIFPLKFSSIGGKACWDWVLADWEIVKVMRYSPFLRVLAVLREEFFGFFD